MTRTAAHQPSRKPRSAPSLWPREHGAYAQVLFPLITVVLVGGLTWSALLLGVSIGLAFLANEPLLIIAGHRGPRVSRDLGKAARMRGAQLVGASALTGATSLVMAPEPTALAVLPLLVAAGCVVALAVAKREKTWYGEALVALTLSYSAVPVGLAGGIELRSALAVAAVWTLNFWFGLATVHALLRRAKRHDPRLAIAVVAVGSGVALLATSAGLSGIALGFAILPSAVAGAALTLSNFSPKKLRTVGWTLVGAHFLTAAVLPLLV